MIKKEAAIAVLRECINNKDAVCSTQSKKDAFLLAIDALKKLDRCSSEYVKIPCRDNVYRIRKSDISFFRDGYITLSNGPTFNTKLTAGEIEKLIEE